MVVQGIIALALALPTGMLFGVGYGTGVRIGYEQIYPLLFPKGTGENNAEQVKTNMKAINTIYDTIGGKEASNMGIAQGLNSARSELENNPDFQFFTALESNLSGLTQSNSASPSNSSTPESLALAESFNTQNSDIQAQANLIREITDIPSLIRMRDREHEKPITSQYLIATINARVNQLRSATSPQEQTIQQRQQEQQTELNRLREIEENKPTPNIGTNLGTITGSYQIAQYQNKTFSLQRDITNANNAVNESQIEVTRLQQIHGTAIQLSQASSLLGRKKTTLSNKQKLLQNHIITSRSITVLKPYANPDWNNRIWKV